MAITPKPKPAPQTAPPNVDIEALINKGGSVASPNEAPTEESQNKGKPSTVNLRIDSDILKRIDIAVQSRNVRIPRHTWMMEALVEKLLREESV
jgi:hypothetical protein